MDFHYSFTDNILGGVIYVFWFFTVWKGNKTIQLFLSFWSVLRSQPIKLEKFLIVNILSIIFIIYIFQPDIWKK